jgi:hypothetical protein
VGAIQPINLRHLPFGGSAASGTTHFIGANGSTFMPGGANDRDVPGMAALSVVVGWEIRNNDAAANLLVRYGPNSAAFTAAAGTTLDNYVTVPPGIAYNFPVVPPSQQINDAQGGSVYSILLIQGDGAAAAYTGVVTVWDPADE